MTTAPLPKPRRDPRRCDWQGALMGWEPVAPLITDGQTAFVTAELATVPETLFRKRRPDYRASWAKEPATVTQRALRFLTERRADTVLPVTFVHRGWDHAANMELLVGKVGKRGQRRPVTVQVPKVALVLALCEPTHWTTDANRRYLGAWRGQTLVAIVAATIHTQPRWECETLRRAMWLPTTPLSQSRRHK